MQPAPDEPRLLVGRVDRLREQLELVGERGVVGTDRRDEILREELELEAPVAADEAETVALLLCAFATAVFQSTCTPSWRGVSENRFGPAVKTTGTRDTRAERRSSSRCASVARQAADVDPRDPGAVCELVRRAGEDQAEADRDDRRSHRESEEPGPETAPRGRAAAGADSRGRRSHEPRMVAAVFVF